MRRSHAILAACLVPLAGIATGCGSAEIGVPQADSQAHQGAVLFNQHCSGCHTLGAAAAEGSRPAGKAIGPNERTNGPNFDQRREVREDVLFAIRNGGFSGAIMPANIVVGADAQKIAYFVERYAGSKAPIQR